MDLANARPMRLALTLAEPKPGERILDSGCGTGAALAMIRAMAATYHLYGIDRSQEMVAVARQRLGSDATLACSEIAEIPSLNWQPFDAVLALNVLYFADERGEMIAALRNALRQGGRLIAYVTHRHTMERWRFTNAGLHQMFDVRDLEDALVQGGFARASISIKEHDVAPGIRGLVAHAER